MLLAQLPRSIKTVQALFDSSDWPKKQVTLRPQVLFEALRRCVAARNPLQEHALVSQPAVRINEGDFEWHVELAWHGWLIQFMDQNAKLITSLSEPCIAVIMHCTVRDEATAAIPARLYDTILSTSSRTPSLWAALRVQIEGSLVDIAVP